MVGLGIYQKFNVKAENDTNMVVKINKEIQFMSKKPAKEFFNRKQHGEI
ncbi:MAG: hypothetical protein SCALA701_23080 [Candidatus Scalindua sp.]|nr:MAG: hypothetical protein SCALA701_23080 [Candidatus Scalindua sp.]